MTKNQIKKNLTSLKACKLALDLADIPYSSHIIGDYEQVIISNIDDYFKDCQSYILPINKKGGLIQDLYLTLEPDLFIFKFTDNRLIIEYVISDDDAEFY